MRLLTFGLPVLSAVMFSGVSPHSSAAPDPCNPSPCNPTVECLKTVTVTKAVPEVFVIPAGPFQFFVPVRVNVRTGAPPGLCVSCPIPSVVLGGTVTVNLLGAGGPYTGMMPIPGGASGFMSEEFMVPVTVPAGTVGIYAVQVNASVDFSGDSTGGPQTVIATGDNNVCFVEETFPGSGVPRLDIRLVGDPLPQCPAGAAVTFVYEVTNNDPVETVNLTMTAESGQNAYMPTTTGASNRVYALAGGAAGTGDHLPIVFGNAAPPPIANPLAYFQAPINMALSIPPTETRIVEVTMASHGPPAHVPGCLDGTCSDQTLVAQGSFTDNTPALACAGAGFSVNNAEGCGCDFYLEPGSNLGVGDDTTSTVNLGFPFAFPDGTVTTQVDVDSNGRVFPTGLDTSDFDESVGELLNEATSICLWWDDQDPSVFGDVVFTTDGTRATFTWRNSQAFGGNGSNLYNIQLQLHSNGTVVFLYDEGLGMSEDGIAGLSAGNGAADPGNSDLSLALSTFGVPTVYQQFSGGDTDLAGRRIEFVPDGSGGWNTTVIILPCSPPPQPIPGVVTNTGSSTNRAFTYAPNGGGGYSISRSVGSFVDDSFTGFDLNSLAVGSGDDENYTVSLGFPFTFPGGATVTDIVIDTNGRILADGSDGSDFSPSVPEALTGAPGAIVPWWCDLSPQLGTFVFATDGVSEARITMLDAPQFAENNAISWQCTLRADDSFTINYIDTHTWRTGFGSTTDDVIAGCFSGTAGTGADPGEGDHAATSSASNAEGTFYEFWDASPTPGETPAVQPVLDLTEPAELGGVLSARMTGISDTATLTSMFLGFSNPGDLPLDLIGIEGGTLSSSADVIVSLTTLGESASFIVPLPLDTGFVGLLDLHLQGIYVSFGDTTLGSVLTNGLNVSF